MKGFEDYIRFFNSLKIDLKDVTTLEEKQNFQKVVIATYTIESKKFETNKLYYKRVTNARNVKNAVYLDSYFNDEVYWLDIDEHEWPQSSGETDIDELIVNDITHNPIFKNELLKLANNQGTGFIQLISKQGRSNQYYRNFENNNHWHDIILLIKAVIEGETNLNPFLKSLVFKWDGNKHTERLRSSLSPHFGNRALLHHLINNVNRKKSTVLKELIMQEYIDLLNFKKQIILQGPPGTGKTRLAKELANIKCGITVEFIKDNLKVGEKIDNVSGAKDYYTVKAIDTNTVSLVSERTTQDWKPTYVEIIKKYNRLISGEDVKSANGLNPYDLAIAKHFLKKVRGSSNKEQIKLIQFHPSFSYEDFVRGIVSKTSNIGIIYEAQNKVLADFAKAALDNYRLSKTDNTDAVIDKWVEDTFNEYKYDIEQAVEEKMLLISGSIGIFEVQHDCFKYGLEWQVPSRINFVDFKKLIKWIVVGAHVLGNPIAKELSVHAHYRNPYYSSLLTDFFSKYHFENTVEKVVEKNYVLIIDEINRANLSTVLGELIYALEYRGEAVESIYEIEGSNKLILPPNLYIIGTMNTADRSVTQIDYAIRRRFAFVDILPEDISSDLGDDFKSDLFKKVAALFVKDFSASLDYSREKVITNSEHLSFEFKPKEVWLGHSYFIQHYEIDQYGEQDRDNPFDFNLRLDYEIKPILREYVKDGILKESALAEIEALSCSV
ncbi:AAA family ATPase [Fluviicola taffensis]|uniref:ATPase associated with various cellular activities AAA_5 n=1 Tax=Fluviicola taffensis (strain DSM 16823 / NCIMB 13979 / RW262) TaxID=755732 RepID=F2IGZ3_FLUTR|nr:AAA family ATPase [Fluviicola taffensis]AEA44774.1 ATPase associated with various cellular activities AAA_5 [Fluviicola taffensis DSM 16823]